MVPLLIKRVTWEPPLASLQPRCHYQQLILFLKNTPVSSGSVNVFGHHPGPRHISYGPKETLLTCLLGHILSAPQRVLLITSFQSFPIVTQNPAILRGWRAKELLLSCIYKEEELKNGGGEIKSDDGC